MNPRPHGPEPCALPTALHPETYWVIILQLSRSCKSIFSISHPWAIYGKIAPGKAPVPPINPQYILHGVPALSTVPLSSPIERTGADSRKSGTGISSGPTLYVYIFETCCQQLNSLPGDRLPRSIIQLQAAGQHLLHPGNGGSGSGAGHRQ